MLAASGTVDRKQYGGGCHPHFKNDAGLCFSCTNCDGFKHCGQTKTNKTREKTIRKYYYHVTYINYKRIIIYLNIVVKT